MLTIQQVLSAPITLCRRSTDAEKKVLADKKDGYFYTIGLASGQKFVAHMGENKDAGEIEEVFTLRPVKNLLPSLREIQWVVSRVFGEHGVSTNCHLSVPVSKEEEQEYQQTLEPHSRMLQLNGVYKYNPQRVWDDHPILDRLTQVLEARKACEEASQSLLSAQKKLKSLEILEKNGSSIKTRQDMQQKRKEKING